MQTTPVSLAEGLDVPLQAFSEIPLIDLKGFDDAGERQRLAEAVGLAARDVGFLYITNHGIPEPQTAALFTAARAFFALPAEEKQRLYRSETTGFRGYRGPFGQNYDPSRQLSNNENYFAWTTPPAGHPCADRNLPLTAPNLWPEGLPGFQFALETYMDAALALSRRLMRLFALALGLDKSHFASMIDAPLGTLSLNRYPPESGRIEREVLGISEHSDYGLLTVLAQDSVPGLQVKNAAGDWVGAPPVPAALVINLGQQMERLTNGLFKATEHRVVSATGLERYSVPFFLEPNWDAVIEVLPCCQSLEHPPAYRPAQAGPYYLEILQRSHAAIPAHMQEHRDLAEARMT
ncbi:MAG: 2-oxoglutarate and iron-dependent oxygenase domain-containing protein [Pseudomonadota bacterium]